MSRDHLYALFGVHTRRVKIGRAIHPELRARSIARSSADEVVLWATAPQLGDRERAIHNRFRAHRLHGEWFTATVTQTIAARVARGDDGAFSDWIQSETSVASAVDIARRKLARYGARHGDTSAVEDARLIRAVLSGKTLGQRDLMRVACAISVGVRDLTREQMRDLLLTSAGGRDALAQALIDHVHQQVSAEYLDAMFNSL